MCEPVTLSVAMGAMAVAGAGLSAVQAQSQAGYQTSLANMNAKASESAAADALARGAQEAGVEHMKGSQLEGRQQVALAKGGIEATGSASDLLTDSRLMSDLDAERMKTNAAREAWGYRTQAAQTLAQASATRAGAGYQVAGSILGGLGGVAGAAGGYYRNKRPGGTGLSSIGTMDFSSTPYYSARTPG